MATERGPGPIVELAPKPPARSEVVDAHFELDYSLIREADITSEAVPTTTDIPDAEEDPDDVARRAWELKWVAGLRNPSSDHVPSLQDTNNLWNYFRPDAVTGLRKSLGRIAEERREYMEEHGEDTGFRPDQKLAYFEKDLYAWIASGTLEKAIEKLGGEKMERILDDMALREVLVKENRKASLPGSRELLAAANLEAATLLNQLAVILYDLGVPYSQIHG